MYKRQVSELSDDFGSLSTLSGYSSDLAGFDFTYQTTGGNLDVTGFGTTNLSITAEDVVYVGRPTDLSGANINGAEIEITLNGSFTLTGSATDVAQGIYTSQSGDMRLSSMITVTDGADIQTSETNFLPTSEITLNFDGSLEFENDNINITDTSKVTVTYDGDDSGSNDTELNIYSQGNNSYISTKTDITSGTITSIEDVSSSAPTITSSDNFLSLIHI